MKPDPRSRTELIYILVMQWPVSYKIRSCGQLLKTPLINLAESRAKDKIEVNIGAADITDRAEPGIGIRLG